MTREPSGKLGEMHFDMLYDASIFKKLYYPSVTSLNSKAKYK